MDVPDSQLTEDERVRRNAYDALRAGERAYNPPLPFVRPDPYLDPNTHGRPAQQDASRDDAEARRRAEAATGMVAALHAKFFPRGVDAAPMPNPMDNLRDTLHLFGMAEDSTPSHQQLDAAYDRLFRECLVVCSAAQNSGALSDLDTDLMVRRMLDRLDKGRALLVNLYANARCSRPNGLSDVAPAQGDGMAMWRFKKRSAGSAPQDMDAGGDGGGGGGGSRRRGGGRGANRDDDAEAKLTSLQELYIYLLDTGRTMGYRRYRDGIMVPVLTSDGRITGAWSTLMTFRDYVLQITERKLDNDGMWYNLTRDKGNLEAAVTYLQTSKDPEMPWLVPDRHVFCFRNGMYMAKEERFVPYVDFGTVFPCGPPVACRYLDRDVDMSIFSAGDYMDIPTPAFDCLFNAQHIGATVRRFVFALWFGRSLYDVGELDDYQVHTFVKGMGGTGKSKLLDLVAALYEPEDVGCLANNIEQKFGLSVIANKFIATADDIRHNLSLDQSDFQNMASGNMVSCPVKHHDPIVVKKWKCLVHWSGNETMDFHDNANSVNRRLVILLFAYSVEQQDMTLPRRLLEELPSIIVKGNWAYRNMLRRYGTSRAIWEFLPREFKEQQQELAASTNALAGLFASGQLEVGRNLYMPMGRLRDMLNEYAKKNGYVLPKWTPDYWRGTFARYHVTDAKRRLEYPRNQVLPTDDDGHQIGQKHFSNGPFAMGVDVAKSS